MIILAVDTSLTDCACCVFDTAGQTVLAETQQSIGRGHAEVLVPMIADTRSRAGIALHDIGRCAATVGPGSFTGIRVGVAAVRALAMVNDRQAVGILTLDALAAGVAGASPKEPTATDIVAVIDARRDEFYVRRYDRRGVARAAPCLIKSAEIDQLVGKDECFLVGSGAALAADLVAHTGVDSRPAPAIVDVARIAGRSADQAYPAEPVYIRGPDAAPHVPIIAVVK